MKRLVVISFVVGFVSVIVLTGSLGIFSFVAYCDNDFKIVDVGKCEVVCFDDCYREQLIDGLNVCVVNSFEVGGRVVIEGYSNKLKNYVVINGHKINVQFSVFDGMCIVGYPLIKNTF